MAEVRRTPTAEADLETILADLDARDPDRADRFAAALDAKCAALTRFPELGRPRDELAPSLRSTLVKPFVVFYRVRGETVEVVRILHGRQDLKRLLGEPPDVPG